MAVAKPDRPTGVNRPLSPHLQVYAMRINMLMSIMHRITGAALYVGTLLLVWWLSAAAVGPDTYDFVAGILGSIPGQVVLFGYTWALLHHMFGGLRHLVWDTGRGFDLATVDALCWASLIGSVGLTAIIWAVALFA